MKKIIITTAVIVLIGGLITWRLVANKQEIDSKKEVVTTNTTIAITVAEVKRELVGMGISLNGTTEARQSVKVSAKAGGEITEINFKLGDYVAKGAVLARVDDTYSKLALEIAKINYAKYEEDVRRYQALREGDAVTETQLRDIRIAYDNAKIQLEQAQKQWEDTYIRAPFSGYITSKEVDLGKYVNVSMPIAGIADISELKVVLSVSESNVYNLRVGQPISVSTQIYPGATFQGKVAHISPQGDNAHTYPIEISLPNSREYPLKAGTYVDAAINMGDSHPVLLVPREAIVSSVKDPSAYLVEGNAVKLIKITTGKDYGDKIEVIQGLRESDRVVVNGQINLMDGAQVSIIQ